MKVITLHYDETELIARSIRRDRKAQQLLYAKFSGLMLSVCRQYIKDIHHAEDVLITGFMKVFSGLEQFEGKGSFEGWVRRIMVNECISHLRARRQMQYLEDAPYEEGLSDDFEQTSHVEEIQAAIDSLPDGCKAVFNLYAIEGYKHREIAEMLGITEGTSKSQLSHARQLLRQHMANLKVYDHETG